MKKNIYEFKVKDNDKDRKFVIKRPNRRQMEEADTQFAIEMSNCVRKGILTKNMLLKKYRDSGGIMSEGEAKHLSGMYHKLKDLTDEAARLETVKAQTKKNKERLEEITNELVEVRKQIVEVETNNMTLFSNTAESRAQSKVLVWFGTHLLMEEVKGEFKPYFDGVDFEDKLEQYYAREDEENNEVHLEIMNKAGSIIAFWYYNQGLTDEKFHKLLEEFLKEETVEEKEEDTESDE